MTRAWFRLPMVLTVVIGVLLSAGAPASAGFAASTGAPQVTVSTATVQPPSNVVGQLGSCSNGRWMSVTVSWDPSPSPRLSGYTVRAHYDDGRVITVGTTGPTATSITTTVDRHATGSTTVAFTVLAAVSGWTAESVRSGTLTC